MRSVDVTEYLPAAEGGSNTPSALQICNGPRTAAYIVAGVGVDQMRLVMSLSGDSALLAESLTNHDYRPKGMPSMRMLGAFRQDGYRRVFDHFAGGDGPKLFYHRRSATLHVDVHFPELRRVGDAVTEAAAVVDRLGSLGLWSLFPVRVGRVDFTGDVVFRSPAYFRHVFSAFRAMVCEKGRVVDPYKGSTLYLHASRAKRAKRLGRLYDKGAERAAVAGWDVPPERYLRIEAEAVWNGAERPRLGEVTSDTARSVFLDRFGSVGRGTVLLKGGLVEPLMELLMARVISSAQYEQLYTFLDMCRMGLAREIYGRDTYLRRARVARDLGLEVPGLEDRPAEDLEHELDVRALVHEIAAAF